MAIEIFIAGTPPVVFEGELLDEFTLLADSPIPSDESVTVDIEIRPGTATPGEDYEYLSPTAAFDPLTGIYSDSVTIPGGASISSFGINLLQDTLVEAPEFFNVNIVGISGDSEFGQRSSVAVTILDDENVVPNIVSSEGDGENFFNRDIGVPNSNQVTIATELNATEHSASGQFLVSIDEAVSTETVVAYSVEGTATANVDYSVLTGSITIPAGALNAPIDVTILDDKYLEGRENVVATLESITAGDDSLVLGGVGSTATMTIEDSDPTVLYRLNAGGPEITAIDGGPNWLSDTGYLLNQGSSKIFSTPDLVPGFEFKEGVPSEIYNTERFDELSTVDDAELQYAFEVESGTYEVHLYMGNGFEGTSQSGERVFDVAIEGQVLQNLDDIDLSDKFGHLVGGAISNEVVVTDGVLNIDFLHDLSDGKENPLINGIEIVQISDDIEVPPTVSLIEETNLLIEEGGVHKTTFITSEPVPSGSHVDVSLEIIPWSSTPQQDYIYESASATFDPDTGIYTDTVTIPSGSSLGSITTSILKDAVEESSETFTVNIADVGGSNFEIGSVQSVSTTIVDTKAYLSPLRIEAEATTYSSFQLEDLSAASGGQAVKFGGSEVNEVGTLTLSTGALAGFLPGEYEVVLATFDVLFAGGQSETTFNVELNADTTIGNIILREPLEGVLTTPGMAVERTVAEPVLLGGGDTLTITGFENPNEVFWLDYIQLNPVGVSDITQG